MHAAHFSHVEHWVFDLDNTLYPPEARLFDLIEAKMTDWVARRLRLSPAEADRLRHAYWSRYGTTLAGLMAEHGIDPGDYLARVHDIPLDRLSPDPALRAAIARLPGRRIVHTNGCAAYAERVLAARGLAGLFDAVYGIAEAGYQPKPARLAFETIYAAGAVIAGQAAIFEDDARNLAAPHAMGLRTVHVAPRPEPAEFIHHHTADLPGFVAALSA